MGCDCHSCPLPGKVALAVFTDRPKMIAKLLAVPGVKRHQRGDDDLRAVFEPSAVKAVAAVIRARSRRAASTGRSPEAMARMRAAFRKAA